MNLEPILGLPIAVPLGAVGVDLGQELADAADRAGASGRSGPAFVERVAGIFALRAIRRVVKDLGI